jgi:triacylglycerol lipase
VLRRVVAWALAFTVVAGAALGCGGDGRAPRSTLGPSAARDPVVFVHGLHGSGAAWGTMVARLRADGWPASRLDAWSYDSDQSNVVTAQQLSVEVDRVLAATRARRVDLVTHSMGALPSRYYLEHLGGSAKVDAWVSLAGPNRGIGVLCPAISCQEMQSGSAFLKALNGRDPTPGPTRYATWRSPCDRVVPPDAVTLAGARSTTTACLDHGALPTDAAVYRQVRHHRHP